MKNLLFILSFCSQAFSLSFLAPAEEWKLSDKETSLVEHVQSAIKAAEAGESKLSSEVLAIKGMSSPKIRHFLNNICSRPETRYFEVGTWQGSTFISAVYGNENSLKSIVSNDNWSMFGGPKDAFFANCAKLIPNASFVFSDQDTFSIELKDTFTKSINTYFYDGDHAALAQEKALTYFNETLDDLFIYIVDDWNRETVREGTFKAIKKLNYDILYQESLPATPEIGDTERWWNGLYVAVLRKAK